MCAETQNLIYVRGCYRTSGLLSLDDVMYLYICFKIDTSFRQVATKYKTVLMANAFPSAFLEPLLRISLARDPGIRRIVQEILHTLLDRHENTEKLKTVR